MRLGLLYDLQTDPRDPRQAEFDPPGVIAALTKAFEQLGHTVVPLGGARDVLADPDRLRSVNFVFNIGEGDHHRCREAWAPMVLELYGVPYAGSDALALALGLDKVMTKRLAAGCGIATPRWICVERPQDIPAEIPFDFPALVKPRYEGSGVGIDQDAIVRDVEALGRRVARVIGAGFGPALVEEFIPFGELTVCLIGNDPVVAYPAIQRPIDRATRLSCHVVRGELDAWETPLVLDEPLDAEARRVAVTVFEALGCRDMARVDLRVDEAGRVYFLEINPLPSFDPEGSFGLLAEHLGVAYAELVGRILDAARRRLSEPSRGRDEAHR